MAEAHGESANPTPYAAGVYGTIIVTSLVAARRHDEAGDLVLVVLGTTLVLWLAHMWTGLVADRITHGAQFGMPHVRHLLREEAPLITSGLIPAAVVSLAWVDVLGHDAAVNAAIIIGLLELVAWGFLAARRIGSGLARVLAGLVFGLLGVGIVGLEVLITH